jgi:uncharacterized protein YggE
MAPLLITCTGTSSLTHPPELATIHLTITSTSPSQSIATENVTKTSRVLASHLMTLMQEDDAGTPNPTAPASHWSLGSLSTASWLPRADEPPSIEAAGTRVFSASISISATFRDFSLLGSFSGQVGAMEFVSISHVEWSLTAETLGELQRRGRREAVKDAMGKARDYADAVGRVDFDVLEISDVGQGGGGRMMMMQRGGGEGEGEVGFRPEDVRVECEVVVKFDAA